MNLMSSCIKMGPLQKWYKLRLLKNIFRIFFTNYFNECQLETNQPCFLLLDDVEFTTVRWSYAKVIFLYLPILYVILVVDFNTAESNGTTINNMSPSWFHYWDKILGPRENSWYILFFKTLVYIRT